MLSEFLLNILVCTLLHGLEMPLEEHSVEPKQPLIKCNQAAFNPQLVVGDAYNYTH